jgi:hypothetical protein
VRIPPSDDGLPMRRSNRILQEYLDKLVHHEVVSSTVTWNFQNEERVLETSGVEFVNEGRKSTARAKESYPLHRVVKACSA